MSMLATLRELWRPQVAQVKPFSHGITFCAELHVRVMVVDTREDSLPCDDGGATLHGIANPPEHFASPSQTFFCNVLYLSKFKDETSPSFVP